MTWLCALSFFAEVKAQSNSSETIGADNNNDRQHENLSIKVDGRNVAHFGGYNDPGWTQRFVLDAGTNMYLTDGSIYGSKFSSNAHLFLEANNDKNNTDERIKFFVADVELASFMNHNNYRSLDLHNGTGLRLTGGDIFLHDNGQVHLQKGNISLREGNVNLTKGYINLGEGKIHLQKAGGWNMTTFGSDGAHQYMIGRGGSENERRLTLHIPDKSQHGNTGHQPSLDVVSSNANRLFSVEAATGNVWVKGNTFIERGKLSFKTHDNFKKIALWDNANDWYGLGMALGEVRMQIGAQGGNRFSFYRGNNRLLSIEQNGTVIAKRVQLDIGSFPDYVFANGYDLMPLEQVEAYIKANKHLPNMPSEAEVVKNGMDVGKINTILVEKVEELTLHTIAQQKHIKKLNSKLKAFEQQLKEIKNLLKK